GSVRSAARSLWHRVLAGVQGPRRLPHSDAVGIARTRRILERRALAAHAAAASRVVGGRAGARRIIRAAWVSAAARVAPRTTAAARRRHRIPEPYRIRA